MCIRDSYRKDLKLIFGLCGQLSCIVGDTSSENFGNSKESMQLFFLHSLLPLNSTTIRRNYLFKSSIPLCFNKSTLWMLVVVSKSSFRKFFFRLVTESIAQKYECQNWGKLVRCWFFGICRNVGKCSCRSFDFSFISSSMEEEEMIFEHLRPAKWSLFRILRRWNKNELVCESTSAHRNIIV